MESLIPDKYYHVFNHANGNENLFKEDRNYVFFLEKIRKYILNVADVYAYCLMPNHFHFLIRIKGDIYIDFKNKETKAEYNLLKTIPDRENFISVFVSKQFSNLFSSYTQAYNKEYSRRGSLFLKNFKRNVITDDRYFLRLVNYIHFNPVVHGFTRELKDWKYSSFNSIVSDKPTLIQREVILNWFDGLDNFKYSHRYPLDI